MTLTPDTESAFRHYLENDPKKTKCGVHKFTMEQFGLTKKDLKEEFKEYIDFMTGKGFPEEDVLWGMSRFTVVGCFLALCGALPVHVYRTESVNNFSWVEENMLNFTKCLGEKFTNSWKVLKLKHPKTRNKKLCVCVFFFFFFCIFEDFFRIVQEFRNVFPSFLGVTLVKNSPPPHV